jgi:hypothetical protein
MKILTADSMKWNKLKRRLETLHAECVNKQKQVFEKLETITSVPSLVSSKVSYRIAKCKKVI